MRVSPDLLRRLKHLAADADSTLNGLVVEALEQMLADRGYPPTTKQRKPRTTT